MATGYPVTVGDDSLDHGDYVSAVQTTFTISSALGIGEWNWTGQKEICGKAAYGSDTGTYCVGSDGKVYFIPDNTFPVSGDGSAVNPPPYASSGGTVAGTAGHDQVIDDQEAGPDRDILLLGTFANLSTPAAIDNRDAGFSDTVTLDDGSLLNFSEIENIICFTPGTLIATPHGARDIATLQRGDRVVTRDHGLRSIRWIQRRTVPAVGCFSPIRIRPGVVTGLERDIVVSPQHRMLFQGYRAELLFGESEVLVAAAHLVDGVSVTQEQGGNVTYIHMMFDEHEIVYAEGAATESFYPSNVGLTALSNPAREELFALFPELRSSMSGYGHTARRCLKKSETRLLVR